MLNTHTLCANEAALNAHLAEADNEQRRLYAIEKHASNLLATTNNPTITGNALEALSEHLAGEPGLVLRHLVKALESEDRDCIVSHAEQLGLLLIVAVRNYWVEASQKEATADVDASCPHCFGEGCKRCGYDG